MNDDEPDIVITDPNEIEKTSIENHDLLSSINVVPE